MISKQAIKKAIEGGWGRGKTDIPLELMPLFLAEHPEREYQVALDPTFWRALGRVLGWGTCNRDTDVLLCKRCGASDMYIQAHPDEICGADYKQYAHDFYDLVLTGGDTEKFWEEILK